MGTSNKRKRPPRRMDAGTKFRSPPNGGAIKGNTHSPTLLGNVMPARHSRHIVFTGQLAESVASEVTKGRYASVSDMVRTALHLLKDRDEASVTRRAEGKRATQPVRHRA